MEPMYWLATPAEVQRSEESDYNLGRQTVGRNGQGQSFYLSSSSTYGDDLWISEEVVSSEHCKQASGCLLSSYVTLQVSPIDFGSQAMPPCEGECTECGTPVTGGTMSSPTDSNHSPSVMVLGANHHRERRKLVELVVVMDRTLNCQCNIRLFCNSMLSWATGVFGRNFVYVQNNATPHSANDIPVFRSLQGVKVMDWRALSPDMNPIEHVWDHMGAWIRDMDAPFQCTRIDVCCPPRAGFHDTIIWDWCFSIVELPLHSSVLFYQLQSQI